MNRPTPSALKPRRLLLLVLVVALLAGALELAFRRAGAHRFVHWLEYGHGTQQGLLARGHGRIEVYSSANRRFWPMQLDAEPARDVWRIVVVGDSVARGNGPQASWPAETGRALREAGCRAEVINLSSPGYGSARKLQVTRMALAQLKPGLVLLQPSMTTEVEDTLDARRRDEAAADPLRIERLSWAVLWLKERKYDILYSRWLSARIRDHGGSGSEGEGDGNARADAIAAKTDTAHWYPQVLANTRTLAAEVARAGATLVMAPRWSLDRASGRLVDYRLRELSLAVAGAERTFDWTAAVPAERQIGLLADGTHFRRDAHAVIGEATARWLLAQGLCPATGR